jgi:hypothetical protein
MAKPDHPMQQTSFGRWWSWFESIARRRSCPVSSNRRPRRSATGSSKTIVMTAALRRAVSAFGRDGGYHPRPGFVHLDTGRVRSWR